MKNIPAFPVKMVEIRAGEYVPQPVNGMTLLDYFAAKAMQAMIIRNGSEDRDVAKDAYEVAGAMVEEREKINEISTSPQQQGISTAQDALRFTKTTFTGEEVEG